MPDVPRGVYKSNTLARGNSVLWLSHGDGFWIMCSMHMYAELSARTYAFL